MKHYNIADLMAQEQVLKCFKRYGIEGTEQKIIEIYQSVPKIQKLMLKAYKTIIKGI